MTDLSVCFYGTHPCVITSGCQHKVGAWIYYRRNLGGGGVSLASLTALLVDNRSMGPRTVPESGLKPHRDNTTVGCTARGAEKAPRRGGAKFGPQSGLQRARLRSGEAASPPPQRPAAPLVARGDPQKSPAEERADQLSSMLLRPALLCCACPQQRQLSELLAPLSLCRLLTDAFALLREPLEHTCDVHRTLLRTLWRVRHRVLAWLCKRDHLLFACWFIPTVPQTPPAIATQLALNQPESQAAAASTAHGQHRIVAPTNWGVPTHDHGGPCGRLRPLYPQGNRIWI